MKDKIERFSKGIFSYDHPELIVSESSINIRAEAGKAYEGSFCVSSSADKPFKGAVVASDSLITFEQSTFYGVMNEIKYRFDASYLDINDTLQGTVTVISEFGEIDIPFNVKCRIPACETSIGPASDLFHFTSLAQSNWTEAKNLFKSEEFRNNLSFYNSDYENICAALLKSGNVSLALEQFLIYARKKKPVHVTCDMTSLYFDNLTSSESRSIILKRDTWGYSQLVVEVSGDFIEPERKLIFSEDFTGNEFHLEININPDRLHGGTNYGLVKICGIGTEISVPVVCKNSGGSLKERLAQRRMKYFDMKLVSSLIDFRLGRVSKSRFANEQEKILEGLRAFREETIGDKLLYCYVLYISGKTAQAAARLKSLSGSESLMSDREFAFELYLEAALNPGSGISSDAKDRLREMYDRTGDSEIFICCIELDDKKRLSRTTKYNTLKESRTGSESALVLLEASKLINEEPTVMKEFSGFDLRTFEFGLENGVINKDAVRYAAYLASRTRNISSLQGRVLKAAFAQYKLKEVLEALCRYIIMSGETGKQAYAMLLTGIEDEVPVPGIYERCLELADDLLDRPLPKAMLSYFENGLDVSDEYKAGFYANVIKFRGTRGIGRDHASETMINAARQFTLTKLEAGELSENLAYLYNNLLVESDLDERTASSLPSLIFKHRIYAKNAQTVIVAHKELEEETEYKAVDGTAYCDIFTSDAVILAVEEGGGRIVLEKAHPVRVITSNALMKKCEQYCAENEMVSLHLLENARYRGENEQITAIQKRLINETNLDKKFRLECTRELIEYYYDNLEGEQMEKLLVGLDLRDLNRHDRARMLGLMVQRELYSLAMRNMVLYGFMGVDVRRLSDMTEKLLETGDGICEEPVFTAICNYVFFRRSSTPRVAARVVAKFEGSTESLYRLWRSARDMNVDCMDLEERLLYQILFTENDMSFANEVFRHYYGHGINRRLISAFLSYYAYKCMILDQIAEPEMLDIMRHELMYEDNEICTLAILKEFSKQRNFSDANRGFIEKKLETLVNKGIVMPFFKNFGDGIRLPDSIRERHYVEYHTNPSACVKIHYCITAGTEEDSGFGEYKDVLMKDMGYGIFVKEFMLFYGEVLQYYISEETDDDHIITESGEIRVDPELVGNEETGYHQLNLIITAQEMNDPKTMVRMLETYIKGEFIGKQLFKPIL
ncbi:MAG: DUF5717 family protein [Lachnospiraceae bacterium]|nr:DUF5717 family protein [Lachnospiraceae bacterium]